jgi:hypothetical protein
MVKMFLFVEKMEVKGGVSCFFSILEEIVKIKILGFHLILRLKKKEIPSIGGLKRLWKGKVIVWIEIEHRTGKEIINLRKVVSVVPCGENHFVYSQERRSTVYLLKITLDTKCTRDYEKMYWYDTIGNRDEMYDKVKESLNELNKIQFEEEEIRRLEKDLKGN